MERVKGTFDFYPEDKYAKEAILDTLRTVAERANFKWVETPALETIKLLTRKSGDEVRDQIFVIEQRGAEQFGLRFDMTVPLARMFLAKQKELPKPVKWCYTTRMWRYEAPQKGRLREFYQFGCELFGPATAAADAEVIGVVINALKEVGLSENDFVVKISNRKLIQGLLYDLVPKDKMDEALRIIDRAPKTTSDDVVQQLEKAGIRKVKEVLRLLEMKGKPQTVFADLDKSTLNELAREGLAELKAIATLVPSPSIVLDLSVVRGLAYYTGFVFECLDKQGKYRALAGGGRYDDLVQLLGGEATPAVGFALGYSTLSLLLEELGRLPKQVPAPQLFCVVIDEAVRTYACTVVESLRKKYTVEMDIMGRKVGKQIEQANALKVPYVLFIGPDEAKQQKVKLRDMKTGKETLLSPEDIRL
ncbi:histidine--tRNA ligase [Candidatus Woesearchaeota archaeon]|nr:histidine--tRNA ligase [Candidatus Woesearchaeota archaeon]